MPSSAWKPRHGWITASSSATVPTPATPPIVAAPAAGVGNAAIAGSLPGFSIAAESAAERIIDACRYGDPELTLTLPAKIATAAAGIAAPAIARAMMVVNRLLPPENGADGDRRQRGADSQSKWAPSAATALGDRAAAMNNEV